MSSELVRRLRTKLLSRAGDGGILALGRIFRTMDKNGNNFVCPEEFCNALATYGITMDPSERRALFEEIDTSKDGQISVSEFLKVLRGDGIAPGRRRVVELAWKNLDRDASGVVDAAELSRIFTAKRHPKVLKGEISEEQVLTNFHTQFDCQHAPDGKVTLEEFLNYYAGVSASIDNDLQFEFLVKQAWKVDQPNAYVRFNEEDMRNDSKANFRTSARIPVSAPIPEDTTPPTQMKAPPTLMPHTNPVLDPYPVPKMGIVRKGDQGGYDITTKQHHKCKALFNGDALGLLGVTFEKTFGPAGPPEAGGGYIPAEHVSLLNTVTTTTQDALNDGRISDDAMDVYRRARLAEMTYEKRRAELRNEQPVTAEPSSYDTTYGKAHIFLLPAVDRSVRSTGLYQTNTKKPKGACPAPVIHPHVVPREKPTPYVPKALATVQGSTDKDQEKDYLDTLARRQEERVRLTHGEPPSADFYRSVDRSKDRTCSMRHAGEPLQKTVSRPLNVWNGEKVPNMYATTNQLSQAAFARDVLMK